MMKRTNLRKDYWVRSNNSKTCKKTSNKNNQPSKLYMS